MALVSTGQITIVDNNDARPITAFITASQPIQQIYTKNDTTVTYVPDWTSANNVLTAKVYVGNTSSATEVSTLSSFTNKKWSTTFDGVSIGSGATYTVNTNLTTGSPSTTYYFQGDYTDPVTGLVSRVVAQINLTLVQTGSNAVWVQISGLNVIEESSTATKNCAIVKAELIRSSGIDTDNLVYKWFKLPFNAADQIDANYNPAVSGHTVSTLYSFLTEAQFNTAIATNPPTPIAWGTALPADGQYTGAGAAGKAIQIHEAAISDYGLYKVEVRDTSENKSYEGYFTIYDISDPYDTKLISTNGEKLQNGTGYTDIFPRIYKGATRITDLTGWTFTWYFYDASGAGVRGAFIDTSKTALAEGRNITTQTGTTSAVFTYTDGDIATFAAGDIIKVVTTTGVAKYYEIASKGTNTVTIRTTGLTNSWLSFAAPTAGEFNGGKLFACTAAGTRTTNGGASETAAKITVTGYEIDAKGTIICEANRP